jgi:uncharacterized protein (TIGR02246 family)
MTDEKQIQKLYRDYWTGMIRKDAQGLRDLMAEDYYLEHMTGVRQTRDQFLAGLLAGTFNYYSAEHDSIEVTISGDTAAMIGRSRVLAAVYGGRKTSWKLQGNFTLRKENGAWKLTSSRASTY